MDSVVTENFPIYVEVTKFAGPETTRAEETSRMLIKHFSKFWSLYSLVAVVSVRVYVVLCLHI